jgi:type I restriction enzyme S subunit
VPGIDQESVLGFEVPLPPLPEQRRIVAKIEELFSNLDAGMDDLQAAGQQLKRYRLSVLQAAVEGCLTADWRRTHDPEPADQLLERILEERRKQWERDYRENYRKKERDLPSGWKSRYSEAEEPETEELEELSKGWTWTSLDQLLSNMRNGYSKAPKADDGVPILRISSVRPLSVNLDDVRYLEGKPDDYEKYLIEPGYLLFIRYNGNPGLVGACGAVPALDQPYAHPDKLIRGEVADHETVMPSYLEIALNMGPSREHIQNRVRTTAGQAGISQGDLYSCPVPVPPPAEQKQIVDEVERLLSVADDAAATAEREQTRAERLRQSILKQAFSGQLVPHEEDAAPPAIEASSSNGTGHDSSGSTGSSTEEDSSGEDDVVAEELHNDGDPGKQIEMDL